MSLTSCLVRLLHSISKAKWLRPCRLTCNFSRKRPDIPTFITTLGVALRSLDKLEAAVACYKRALAYGPDAGNVYSNLGNSLRELARFDEAGIAHKRAIELSEESASAIYNAGLVDRGLYLGVAAMEKHDCALKIDPDYVDCHWDRSLVHLLNGN
jgi:tetratricopeptide (TPR) repeat protein